MPRRPATAAARPRRAYKAQMKTARRTNRVNRVIAQPERQARRRAAGNAFLSGVGRTIAPLAGSVINALGKRAMTMISGQGDYDISGITHNSLVGKISPTVPVFSSNTAGMIRVQHREYLTDILSTTDFNNLEFPINPALASTFPWLSKIAANFEQYQIHGLIFEFKSGSSDALNSTNTALGYVVMATEYNSLAPGYQNKLEMENALFACSTKPSLSTIHAVECAPTQSPLTVLYTRTGFENIGESDIRFYDLGKFNIATVGMQAIGANIGELFVSYDISLSKTRYIPPGLTIPTYSVQFGDVDNARALLGSNVSQVIKINTLNVNLAQTFNGATNICSSIFTLPPGSAGSYIFNYQLVGDLSTNAGGVSGTFPFQSNPFNSLVNITERNIYPSDEAKLGFNHDVRPYNANVVVSAQLPTSVSQFLTYSFTIVNNNLPASFTFSITNAALLQLVKTLGVSPFTLGVCYITQVNSQL
nr:putative capsid protein [Crucivirus sp.]